MVLATSDPAGRALRVRVARAGHGVVALRATVAGPRLAAVKRVGIAFRARAGERYLGFGERSNAVTSAATPCRTTSPRGPSSRMSGP
jgi:hypothetical protein